MTHRAPEPDEPERHALFLASDGVTGSELWKSDGTEAGTVNVKEIFPGSGFSFCSSSRT